MHTQRKKSKATPLYIMQFRASKFKSLLYCIILELKMSVKAIQEWHMPSKDFFFEKHKQ